MKSKHQARCLCGWKGSWTLTQEFARAEGRTHAAQWEGPAHFDHQVLVAWGSGVDYAGR